MIGSLIGIDVKVFETYQSELKRWTDQQTQKQVCGVIL